MYSLASVGNTIFAAGPAGIYSSTDFGQTWNSSLAGAFRTLKEDSGNLYAGGTWPNYGAVWTSTNTGQTWTDITPYIYNGIPNEVLSFLINPPYLYVGVSQGQNVYKCPLANLNQFSWTTFTTGNPQGPMLEFNGTNIIAGSFGAGVFQSSPSTPQWTNTSNGIVNTNFLRALTITNSTVLIGTAGSPHIQRSLNGGNTWTPMNTNIFDPAAEVSSIITDSNNIYAGSWYGGVMYSNDYGTSWVNYNLGFQDSLGNWICPNMKVYSVLKMADTLFAATTCGVWKSWGCSFPNNLTSASNMTVCAGSSATLSVSSLGLVNWYHTLSSTLSLGSGTSFISPSLTGNTTFYIENSLCSMREQITVTVNPTPTLNVNGSATICPGQTATLTAGGGVSYTWNPGQISGAQVSTTPSITTIYTVTGSNNIGCLSNYNYTLNVDLCTELSKNSNWVSLRVYPNPSDGNIHVSSAIKDWVQLKVFNSLSQLVYEQENHKEEEVLLNLDLPNGIFLLQIYSGHNLIKQEKLVITK